MRCPRCQFDNPATMKFCVECGAKLAVLCPQCGAENQPTFKFCGQCGASLMVTQPISTAEGQQTTPPPPRTEKPRHRYTPAYLAEKILTSRSALEGERKQVTVLFVDVSGFTALSERLDPEEVHQLMDRAFELMLAEVHHYEGTVNQFLGDGIMALFGAPIAHEDHPIRGVHAALGIQRALTRYREQLQAERGIEFRVRMGLNTGAVVVGKIGDNLRMDYTAVGDTTNLAARLLTLAEPGQILLSEDTAKVVEPYFRLQPLGEVPIKGKTLPVPVYRVEGTRTMRSRIEAVAEQGLTPLVGREQELALLQDRFLEVQAGRGQGIFIFGEAGIGKSRLLLEFRRLTDETGFRWLVGHCVSYGQSIAYLPIIDLVRELLNLEEADSVEKILAKIEGGIRAIGEDLVWTVPFIRALLSLDPGDPEVVNMMPIQRRGYIEEALRALFIQASQRQPVVLVIEDLHWIDSHSEEVIRLLLESIAATPLFVLLTHRPGYTPPFEDQTYYTRITLHRLPEAHMETLVEQILQSADIPDAVKELIAQKAEGNPLFIEELSKALVEEGTLHRVNGGYQLTRPLTEVTIPGTIQGVIMARIDRLPEAAKAGSLRDWQRVYRTAG